MSSRLQQQACRWRVLQFPGDRETTLSQRSSPPRRSGEVLFNGEHANSVHLEISVLTYLAVCPQMLFLPTTAAEHRTLNAFLRKRIGSESLVNWE